MVDRSESGLWRKCRQSRCGCEVLQNGPSRWIRLTFQRTPRAPSQTCHKRQDARAFRADLPEAKLPPEAFDEDKRGSCAGVPGGHAGHQRRTPKGQSTASPGPLTRTVTDNFSSQPLGMAPYGPVRCSTDFSVNHHRTRQPRPPSSRPRAVPLHNHEPRHPSTVASTPSSRAVPVPRRLLAEQRSPSHLGLALQAELHGPERHRTRGIAISGRLHHGAQLTQPCNTTVASHVRRSQTLGSVVSRLQR